VDKAVKLGKTIVITNAAYGWVEASGRKFLPNTFKMMIDQQIEIISARQLFEDQFPSKIIIRSNPV
jgi:hypothetical protein